MTEEKIINELIPKKPFTYWRIISCLETAQYDKLKKYAQKHDTTVSDLFQKHTEELLTKLGIEV